MNFIFVGLIAVAVVTAAFTGTMGKVSSSSLEAAQTAVTLAFSLVAQMTLWLGLMGVLAEAGVMRSLARLARPLMTRLFPDVPPEHPAMSAMIMNLAANVLGLNNAATPFGLKAMSELDRLNPHKGVATNAMALFLVINTAGLAVLPLTVVAARAVLHSKDPAGVIVPSLIATVISTVVAVALCKAFQRMPRFALSTPAPGPAAPAAAKWDEQTDLERAPLAQQHPVAAERAVGAQTEVERAAQARQPPAPAERTWDDQTDLERLPARGSAAPGYRRWVSLAVAAALLVALVLHFVRAPADATASSLARGVFSEWVLPLLMLAIVLIGFGRQVQVYDAFIRAAKEGFGVGVMVLPYLVAILVSVGMLRASGALDAITSALGPVTASFGFPSEALPMALIRPLSGGGANGVMIETMTAHGPDSFVGYLVSLINGSSETTFYVLSVYFGAVQVRAIRHTLVACLLADAVGVAIATAVCHLFFGR